MRLLSLVPKTCEKIRSLQTRPSQSGGPLNVGAFGLIQEETIEVVARRPVKGVCWLAHTKASFECTPSNLLDLKKTIFQALRVRHIDLDHPIFVARVDTGDLEVLQELTLDWERKFGGQVQVFVFRTALTPDQVACLTTDRSLQDLNLDILARTFKERVEEHLQGISCLLRKLISAILPCLTKWIYPRSPRWLKAQCKQNFLLFRPLG